ncbi:MAG: RluA family pseudouridine synthase [Bacilli bacterium]
MIKVVYEDNHLLVVQKPINIPVQEDESKDMDFCSMLKKYIKDKYNKPGNVYLGMVHRLDRPVSGIMVFARTSKAASRLSESIKNREFNKIYYAVVMGNINDEGRLVDKLLKNSNNNTVSVNDKGKEATLSYKKIGYKKDLSLIRVSLETGRSHQIRVQLANAGFPIFGDQKYNSKALLHTQIALFASEVSFKHPITKEEVCFKLNLPTRRPWNLFDNINEGDD